jgi:hypothetical protein
VSREVSEELGWGFVAEASQSGSIVVVDEGMDEGVALGVIGEAVFTGVAGGSGVAFEGFGEAAIEALGHAVGLRMVGSGEFVADAVALAELVEGMGAGATVALAPARIAEAVGELRAVVGEDGVDGMAEGLQKALQAGGDGRAAAFLDDLDVDEAGGAFDGDEDVGRLALQARQVFQVDVDIAEGFGGEALGSRFGIGGLLRDAPALEAAVQGRAGDIGAQAAAHDLQGIVERKSQPGAQFDGDLLLFGGKAGGQGMGRGRAIGHVLALFPAPDRCLADAEFARQRGRRLATRLDVGPHFRRGRRVGMQRHQHRRLSSHVMPDDTPTRSCQPSGTKHFRRDPRAKRAHHSS